MISGDHESTAISVAEQLGIAPEFVVAGKLGYSIINYGCTDC